MALDTMLNKLRERGGRENLLNIKANFIDYQKLITEGYKSGIYKPLFCYCNKL